MLESVDVGSRKLASYRGVAPDPLLDDLMREAGHLRGARVVHVNATPYGAGILPVRGRGGARWIWRCHIDTSEPNPQVWAFLRPFLALEHEPVCGMVLGEQPDATAEYRGVGYRFCSERCRRDFLRAPQQYAGEG